MITFWGKVRKGKGRGKTLGFPTANIVLHRRIAEGVYISKAKVKGIWHPSLTFIGAAKTFGEKKVQAETYIMFGLAPALPAGRPERWKTKSRDMYGRWVSIKLLKKLRGNKKFANASELVKQMKEDEKQANKYFESAPPG